MRAKTKFQHRVVAVNERLLPITKAQSEWAIRNALRHYAYHTASGKLTCLDCNHQWVAIDIDKEIVCPHCGAVLEIMETRKRTAQERCYFSVMTTADRLQLQRVFRIEAVFHKRRLPEYHIHEVCRLWMDEKGKQAVTGLRRTLGYYMDKFVWDGNIELRQNNDVYCYLADNSYLYPRYKVLPVFRRNGLKGSFHGMPPMDLMNALLTESWAETMMKAGRIDDLAYFLRHRKEIKNCWHSYRITLRRGYTVADTSLWADYIRLLSLLGKDTHNAAYVCPTDLQTAHDKILRMYQAAEERRKLKEKRDKALSDEKTFQEMKGKFIGLSFSDGNLEVSVLESVAEYLEESTAMHHCCYDLAYYLKPNSLCFSAHHIGGEKIETVELSLESFKVLQSRGICNKTTEYHNRIIDLVHKNVNLVKERMSV